MIIPTIHLNGTSKEELLRQLSKASIACANAEETLAAAMPHGRDYYPKGGAAIYQAQDEHRARIEKVATVRKEIDAIWEAIFQGKEGKNV
jgi:hypothetical protein